ncbi:hypothetical protein L4D20_14980 [Vibrio kyushuensis]|uniref:tetratricopeptide repeat protein n=1 Tax=Vibrio kyushuensis TaxID=2910249 RepID=UPI003D0A6A12
MNKTMILALSTLLAVPTAIASSVDMNIQGSSDNQSAQAVSSDPIAQLAYQAQDVRLSDDQRAAALRALGSQATQNGLVAVARGLKDASPIIREAAIIGADPYPLEYRWRLVSPLLVDDVAQVRITAAAGLLKELDNLDSLGQVESQDKQHLLDAANELITHLKSQPDDASNLLLADVYRWTQQYDLAKEKYLQSKKTMPDNPQIWLSLADNYRAQGFDQLAVETLSQAINVLPTNANLHFAKSLALVRQEQKSQAAKESHLAATIAESNSYYWYINGVLQEELDLAYSTKSFEQAYMLSGAPEHLYAVCDIYARYGHDKTDECISELAQVAPDEVIQQLKDKRITY